MKKLFSFALLFLFCFQMHAQGKFPDGTVISKWFTEIPNVSLKNFSKKFIVTDYGVTASDSTLLQTEKLQAVIDRAAQEGGGVVVIPQGTYLSGALFFKQGTHLCVEKNAKLKGSDDIKDFPLKNTRMEGQTLKYFTALINADGLDGFSLFGNGTIDGNGLRYWRNFWLRRSFNPKCTNMDEMRPRLVYISNCKNVIISGLHLQNSPFWSTHLYRCERVKYLNVSIYSPAEPVKAPSTDAIDIDVCKDMLIKGCYISVNDDGIVLKGGKGPYADQDKTNGSNENIIIEYCTYGFCHSCLTCGSESIHDRNIIMRRCNVNRAQRLLWLKMRPDTPQNYEYITLEDVKGNADNFLYIRPWTQFFDLKGRKDTPISYSSNVTMRNIQFNCTTFFNVEKSDQYQLNNFTFENLDIRAKKADCDKTLIKDFTIKNVKVNGIKLD